MPTPSLPSHPTYCTTYQVLAKYGVTCLATRSADTDLDTPRGLSAHRSRLMPRVEFCRMGASALPTKFTQRVTLHEYTSIQLL